jgi:hypothetical protein
MVEPILLVSLNHDLDKGVIGSRSFILFLGLL